MEHDEEEVTLCALLSFLDSMESSGLDDPSLSVSDARPSQLMTPMDVCETHTSGPKKRRNRLKVEVDKLRNQAKELETQLAFLRSHHRQADAPPIGTNVSSTEMVGMWKNVAARQFHQRQDAQLLNAHLREMVATKAKIFEGITRLIQRGGTLSNPQLGQASSLLRSFQDWQPSWISIKCSHLMAIVGAMYDHSHLAFPVEMSATGEVHQVQGHSLSPRGESAFFDMHTRFSTPFECHLAADAVASVIGEPSRVKPDGHGCEDAWECGVSMKIYSPDWPEHCHNVFAGRRFKVNDRHLILLAGEIYAAPSDPHIFRFEKWIEVAPFGSSTHVRVRDIAIASVTSSVAGFELSTLRKFCVENGDSFVEMMRQRIEERLLGR